MANRVICIGRQYGSGGHNIGKLLSEKLGIDYYDQNLLSLAVEYSGIQTETLEKVEEKPINPWLYTVLHEHDQTMYHGILPNDALFNLQSTIILEAAKKGDCVIVGRCADYVLRKEAIKRLSLFIVAPFEARVKRTMEHESLDERAASNRVRKMDRQRSSYYNFYTGQNWGNPDNYDLCINTQFMDIEQTASLLAEWVKRMDHKI